VGEHASGDRLARIQARAPLGRGPFGQAAALQLADRVEALDEAPAEARAEWARRGLERRDREVGSAGPHLHDREGIRAAEPLPLLLERPADQPAEPGGKRRGRAVVRCRAWNLL